jgi:hypothetical protein
MGEAGGVAFTIMKLTGTLAGWFHIAMRIQQARLTACFLPTGCAQFASLEVATGKKYLCLQAQGKSDLGHSI